MKPALGAVLLAAGLAASACASKWNFAQLPNSLENSIALPPGATYVCDPFDSGRKADSSTGIIGKLHYLEPSMPRYGTVQEYIDNGNPFDSVILFINRLYVPTRPFDRGFVTLGGDTLRNENGETLMEYFAVDMRTNLGLAAGEMPGDYQLALITDDGSILSIGSGAAETVHIDNDGLHSSKMKCATDPIRFDATTRLPARIRYFQGPRTHISLNLLWREWPRRPQDVQDPECDMSGNDYFFDSTQNPSAPTAVYDGLVARGWRPMSAANFYLDPGGVNPCD